MLDVNYFSLMFVYKNFVFFLEFEENLKYKIIVVLTFIYKNNNINIKLESHLKKKKSKNWGI